MKFYQNVLQNYLFMDKGVTKFNLSNKHEEKLKNEIKRLIKDLNLKIDLNFNDSDEVKYLIKLLKARFEDIKAYQFTTILIPIAFTMFLNLSKDIAFSGVFLSFVFTGILTLLVNLIVSRKLVKYTLLIELLDFFDEKYIK